MDRDEARSLLDRLHAAQGAFYAGNDAAPLRELLEDDVVWTVPGQNVIAGTYAGVESVLAYFRHRRALSDTTLRLHPGELLIGDGDDVAVLTDGTAMLGGVEHRWSTVGLYRIKAGRIAACRLLAFDQAAFDAAWHPALGARSDRFGAIKAG